MITLSDKKIKNHFTPSLGYIYAIKDEHLDPIM